MCFQRDRGINTTNKSPVGGIILPTTEPNDPRDKTAWDLENRDWKRKGVSRLGKSERGNNKMRTSDMWQFDGSIHERREATFLIWSLTSLAPFPETRTQCSKSAKHSIWIICSDVKDTYPGNHPPNFLSDWLTCHKNMILTLAQTASDTKRTGKTRKYRWSHIVWTRRADTHTRVSLHLNRNCFCAVFVS